MKHRKWTESEEKYILDNYEYLSDKALAAKLSEITGQNINETMVRRQRARIGAKKAHGRPQTKIRTLVSENNI